MPAWKDTLKPFMQPPQPFEMVRGTRTNRHIKQVLKKLRKVWQVNPKLSLCELLVRPAGYATMDDELLVAQLEFLHKASNKK